MRILLLCEHFYPHTDACSKRMTVLERELRGRGHEVHVLASETSLVGHRGPYASPGSVHFYPAFEMKKKTVVNRLKNNWSEKQGSESIARKLGSFDVVIVTSPPLMITMSGVRIAKRVRAKLVVDIRDIWPDIAYEMGSFSEKSIYGRVFSRIADKAYKSAFIITTVSEGKAKKLRKQLRAGDSQKIRLVPNGLDLGFLDNRENEAMVNDHKLDQDPPCVYIGNLGLAQGLLSLLRIARNRPNVRFLLFGSGAEENLIRRRIKEWNLANVCLCGRTDESGVYTLLRHARFAYVSLKNSRMEDSVPTKLFEALGCGCPVLLAAQGDSARILDESDLGVSAPPEDAEALLEAFDRMLIEDWSNERRAHAIQYITENHSRQAASRRLVDILEREIERVDGK